MRITSAILSAVIVTAGYYMTTNVMNQKYELGLIRRNGWIFSRIVWAIGVISLLGTGVVSYVRLPECTVPSYLLILLLIWGMSVLAVTDNRKQIIPNRFLILLLLMWTAVVGIYVIVDTTNGLTLSFRALTGGIAGGLIFLLCYLLSGKQLGAGDVKLAFVMGLYLTGQRIIGAIFYGVLFCCVYSLIQLARKKLGLKDGVPIVPFLYMGVLITLFIL